MASDAETGGGSGGGETNRDGALGVVLRTPTWVLTLAVALVAAAVYAPGLGGAWVFDDHSAIIGKDRLVEVASGQRPLLDAATQTQRPLTDLSFAFTLRMQGHTGDGPTPSTLPHLLVNVGIHAVTAAALFLLARLLTGRALSRRSEAEQDRLTARANGLALAVALLWAVHPLTTQAVAYIVQRSESLMSMFALVAMLAFAVFAGGVRLSRDAGGVDAPPGAGRLVWLAVACAAGALSIAAKPVMVGIPILLLLTDRAATGDGLGKLLARRWWAHGLAAVATLGVLVGTGTAQDVLEPETTNVRTVGFAYSNNEHGHGALEHLLTQGEVISHYLRLVFLPHPLALDYQWEPVDLDAGGVDAGVVLGVGFIGVLFLGSLVLVIVRPAAGLAAMVFFVTLGPTSSIVPMRDPAFEHRMYLPSAAVIALVVCLAAWLVRKRGGELRVPAAALAGAVLIIGGALAARTVLRLGDYADADAILASNVAARPDAARPKMNLGLARMSAIRDAADEAGEPIDPDDARVVEALNLMREAVRLEPERAGRRDSFGRWLLAIAQRVPEGSDEKRMALQREARDQFRAAATDETSRARYWFNLGIALQRLGEREAAIEAYKRAHAGTPRPEQQEFRRDGAYNAGNLLAQASREPAMAGDIARSIEMLEEARAWFARSLEIEPDYQRAIERDEQAERALDTLRRSLR